MKMRYAGSVSPDIFQRADVYTALGRAGSLKVSDAATRARLFPWSERHLQCVWFDPALRPAQLQTDHGETALVEYPGVWNSEAEPDFLGAALRIGPEQRRIAGDVEVHLHPADWNRHGHGTDTRYARVRIHVTYFPGRLPAKTLPPGSIQISLKDALSANPMFSFENVNVTAYPQFARATPTPCSLFLSAWAPDGKSALLDAAGEERLRRKAERFSSTIHEKGADPFLYEEIMCALGYKQNKAPFRRLAELVPLESLREESHGDNHSAYAILMGVAKLFRDNPRQIGTLKRGHSSDRSGMCGGKSASDGKNESCPWIPGGWPNFARRTSRRDGLWPPRASSCVRI